MPGSFRRVLRSFSCFSSSSRHAAFEESEHPYSRIVEISEKNEIRIATAPIRPPTISYESKPATPPTDTDSDKHDDFTAEEIQLFTELPVLAPHSFTVNGTSTKQLHRRSVDPTNLLNLGAQYGALGLGAGSLYVAKKTYDWHTKERQREEDLEMGRPAPPSQPTQDTWRPPVAPRPEVRREAVREGPQMTEAVRSMAQVEDQHGRREGWMGMR